MAVDWPPIELDAILHALVAIQDDGYAPTDDVPVRVHVYQEVVQAALDAQAEVDRLTALVDWHRQQAERYHGVLEAAQVYAYHRTFHGPRSHDAEAAAKHLYAMVRAVIPAWNLPPNRPLIPVPPGDLKV